MNRCAILSICTMTALGLALLPGSAAAVSARAGLDGSYGLRMVN